MLKNRNIKMEFNKNHLIYTLGGVIILLLAYIVFQEPTVQTVTEIKYEPLVKTVAEEKVIYKQIECEKQEQANMYEIVEKIAQEYVIASAPDSRYKYTLTLFSYVEPLKVSGFEKTVLNGTIKVNDYEGLFIMDVNQKILETLRDVYFKVKDNETQEVYINHTPCLYNTVANFIYKTDLEIFGNEVVCSVSEDRELEGKAKEQIFEKKLNENMKNTFLKMSPSPRE